jgi:phosphatidylinositol 3-kinase
VNFIFCARLESNGPPYCWNELITLSTKYRDLTVHSQLALTVSGKSSAYVIGASKLSLYEVQELAYQHAPFSLIWPS